MLPLTAADFPFVAVGPHVYRRTMSSPLFTAPDMQTAADIVFRLNRDEATWSTGSGYRSSGELVYG
jgi:hypothetical protein